MPSSIILCVGEAWVLVNTGPHGYDFVWRNVANLNDTLRPEDVEEGFTIEYDAGEGRDDL